MRKDEATAWVWVDVEIKRNRFSEEAVLVSDGDREVWIPRSQIRDEDDDLDEGVHTKIQVPRWLAESKGLV